MHSTDISYSSSPRVRPQIDTKVPPVTELESGYGSRASSAASSVGDLPLVTLTKPHLRFLNQQLERLSPLDRLRLVKVMFPNLYQSTAFGLSGLVTIDMLSKIQAEDPESPAIDLIFLDTLYHFQETLDLVERVKEKYSNIKVHTYRPDGVNTTAEFENQYGEGLYDMSEELYDWIAKVEPQQRAYTELNVVAVLTGRRRSQGGQRDKIPVIEVDDETGIIKINPLVDWSFQKVKAYIDEHNVPYNVLLDRGYKSVGDWHSTSPVGEGEDERAGRWKGQSKTECGIHNKKSRYAMFLEEQQRKEENEKARLESEQLTAALEKVELEQKQAEASI
ncbi:Phosphoadenosine phosphosulfate reductase family-domain-containing protein [Xylariales sp. PMI_506]|nr:Phosphoadenosine phosphosulfate reductase family-domain-containing protein [Xylariales sp. PMI_506]